MVVKCVGTENVRGRSSTLLNLITLAVVLLKIILLSCVVRENS